MLADGICQQKLLTEFLEPLHQLWLQHPDAAAVHTEWLSAAVNGCWGCSNQDWGTLVGLVANCNNMVSSLLKVSAMMHRPRRCSSLCISIAGATACNWLAAAQGNGGACVRVPCNFPIAHAHMHHHFRT